MNPYEHKSIFLRLRYSNQAAGEYHVYKQEK